MKVYNEFVIKVFLITVIAKSFIGPSKFSHYCIYFLICQLNSTNKSFVTNFYDRNEINTSIIKILYHTGVMIIKHFSIMKKERKCNEILTNFVN